MARAYGQKASTKVVTKVMPLTRTSRKGANTTSNRDS